MTTPSNGTCGAHARLGADLRGTALALLERLRVAVEPLRERDGAPPEPGSAGACQACPVCAVVAVLRGERSELAERLAEHATGLVAVLTAVLEHADPAASPRADRAASPNAGPPHADRPAPSGADPAAPSGAEPSRAGRAAPSRDAEVPRPAGYAPRVPGAHGRSVQRITVHRR